MQYYKVDADIMECWFGTDNERIIWWLDCLVMASHKDTESLRAGQFEASLSYLCFRWKAGRRRVENFISQLLILGKISRLTTRQTTVYTISECTNQRTNQRTNQCTNESADISDTYDAQRTDQCTCQRTYGRTYGRTTNTNSLDSYNNITTTTPARAREEQDEQNKPSLMEFFNSTMDTYGAAIPRIKSIQGTRRAALNARIHDYGEEAVREAIVKAAQSPFLNGRGSKIFVASFDWLIRVNNLPKVLEGNYDDNFQQPTINTYDDPYQQHTVQGDADAQRRYEATASLISRLLSEDK